MKLKEQQKIIDELRTSLEQDLIESILSEKCDSRCDICKVDLNTASLELTKNHYSEKHGIENGYIKCCELKLTTDIKINNHIQYHLNPNEHK